MTNEQATNYEQAQNALRELHRVNGHTELPWVIALAARAVGHAVLELAAALRSAGKGSTR
jgi:hypothetical protein